MASLLVKLSNIVTKFPLTVATTSRSFSISRVGRGSLNLFFEAYEKKENDEEPFSWSVSVMGEKEEEEEGVKSIRVINLLNGLKKKEFNYNFDGFTTTMKDGVCQLSIPDVKENLEIQLK